jgi:hypothetical protein
VLYNCNLCGTVADEKHNCIGTGAPTRYFCWDCKNIYGSVNEATKCKTCTHGLSSPNAGGTKHDSDKAPLSLLPPAGLYGAAKVFQFGAQKYGKYNFLAGFEYTRLTSAALRHIWAWIWGESNDKESNLSHIYHAICCLLMLCEIMERGTGTDDRYKGPGQKLDKPGPVE